MRYLALAANDAAVVHSDCPVASHSLLTMHPRAADIFVSDYEGKFDILTRDQAIALNQSLRKVCTKTVFYTDMGWSRGMLAGLELCKQENRPFEIRTVNVTAMQRHKPEMFTTEFMNALLQGGDYKSMLV